MRKLGEKRGETREPRQRGETLGVDGKLQRHCRLPCKALDTAARTGLKLSGVDRHREVVHAVGAPLTGQAPASLDAPEIGQPHLQHPGDALQRVGGGIERDIEPAPVSGLERTAGVHGDAGGGEHQNTREATTGLKHVEAPVNGDIDAAKGAVEIDRESAAVAILRQQQVVDCRLEGCARHRVAVAHVSVGNVHRAEIDGEPVRLRLRARRRCRCDLPQGPVGLARRIDLEHHVRLTQANLEPQLTAEQRQERHSHPHLLGPQQVRLGTPGGVGQGHVAGGKRRPQRSIDDETAADLEVTSGGFFECRNEGVAVGLVVDHHQQHEH